MKPSKYTRAPTWSALSMEMPTALLAPEVLNSRRTALLGPLTRRTGPPAGPAQARMLLVPSPTSCKSALAGMDKVDATE